jgi:hypothetical protein
VLLVSKINTPRHDFGTVVANRTGNLKAVMKVMGHKDGFRTVTGTDKLGAT